MLRDTGWFKSTRSSSGGDICVEVRITDTVIGVRDSKNPAGPVFALDPVVWGSFIAGAKAGDFNPPN